MVSKIIDAKRANMSADTSALESTIDRLVYQLYGLTEEEIAIVEGKAPPPPAQKDEVLDSHTLLNADDELTEQGN